MNYLLKSYKTDSNIAKAMSDIAVLRKAAKKTSVKFADVLERNVV